jgi:parallel beta-helix repeat protein
MRQHRSGGRPLALALTAVLGLLTLVPASVHATHGVPIVITGEPGEVVTLDGDVSDPLVVESDDITLDCQGHFIGVTEVVAVSLAGRRGVTVTNCHVRATGNFPRAGFDLSAASDNTLVGNSVVGAREAVRLDDAHGNTVHDNHFDGVHAGIVLLFSSWNTLSRNTALSGGTGSFRGFGLRFSPDNTLTGNMADGEDGSNSSGFFVDSSPRTTLAGNTATGNPVFPGFLIGFSPDTTLTENTASGNGRGFVVVQTSGVTLAGNAAFGNHTAVSVEVDAVGNTITGNVIGPNTVGIRVCQSAFRDNRIAPNRFIGPQQAFAVNQFC